MSADIEPVCKFSRELRFLITRWMNEGNLNASEIIGCLELHQHEIMTRQFLLLKAEEDKQKPPAQGQ